MTLRVSGKHMDIGDAFRSRIEERIGDVIGKYFDRGYSGHVTVEKQGSRGHRKKAVFGHESHLNLHALLQTDFPKSCLASQFRAEKHQLTRLTHRV